MSANRSTSLLGRSNRYMESSSPSMVHRAGDSLVVRSVVSGTSLNIPGFEEPDPTDNLEDEEEDDDEDDDSMAGENLPQCKIKRNYTCTHCSFFTQNPRTYLYHLKDEHKEKIKVYECPKCVYASKHSQKLQRHIHMVHVIGRQNQKLAKKITPMKFPPMPHLTRADGKDEEGDGVDDSDDEPMQIVEPDPPREAEEGEDLDDVEDHEEEQEEEEDEMAVDTSVDTSAHNSSTENEPEAGTSNEEIKCSMCSFSSYSRQQVQRHENLAHLKKKFFRCTKCNYVTHMKARFTKHVKYHSMPMIKCDLCDFRTPYKWNLDRHYKNHQGDGEFKCPLCNFTADIKQSLTVHVQNHHLTPQQKLMRGMGRRNKVGASDAPAKELRMVDVGLVGAAGMNQSSTSTEIRDRSEDQVEEVMSDQEDDSFQVEVCPTGTSSPIASTSGTSSSSLRRQPKIKLTIKKLKNSTNAQESNERHNYGSDFIHPDDILHKNGKIYYKNLKCSYCSFRAFWEGDIVRHENRVHGVEDPRQLKQQPPAKQQRLARPIPNLIPLQQQQQQAMQQTPLPGTSILKVPLMANRSPPLQISEDATISEQDLNDISSTSALKDFASLIGEAFPLEVEIKEDEEKPKTEPEKPKEKPVKKEASPQPTITTMKKKPATSFFDKLKETLIGKEVENLVCDHCGHESKCLSEAVCHKKVHKGEKDMPSTQRSIVGMVGVSSTRCQHCRHRCKTSADLLIHLQSCLSKDSTSDEQGEDESTQDAEEKMPEEEEEPPQCPNCEQRYDTEDDLNKHLDYCKPRLELNPEVSITEVKPQELHPMENKVFVWNQFTSEPTHEEMKPSLTIERIPAAPQVSLEEVTEDRNKGLDGMDDEEDEDGLPSMVGVETAPGFGAVTSQKGYSILKPNEEDSHVQKVYKCPQCAFWASAASRFHIHLVGHLNRKPFGCSQCEYRSNWRWDVAKHIRLKAVKDEHHSADKKPRVLVNDEDTSRRNYSKYAKFLTLMTVRLGQTQSDFPPTTSGGSTSTSTSQSLPAPPRLIPAPTMPRLEPNLPRHHGHHPLRPPPPLRAATTHVLSQLANSEDIKKGLKRPLSAEVSVTTVDNTKPPEVTKRLLWRCKKCNYRGLNKDQVLAHVRTHYQNLPPAGPPVLTPQVQITKADSNNTENLSCDKCPFNARWLGELKAHQQHHQQQAGAIFKCYLCPFYVGTKKELLSHMKVHGEAEPEDHLSKSMQGKLTANRKHESEDDNTSDMSPGSNKRYKCSSCPYETNAKGQYVYHIQLHGPSTSSDNQSVSEDLDGPPFRCTVCSYTVGKRHLLHQHLRVHGILIPPAKVTSTTSLPPNLPPLDVSKVKDVPLVWVLKNGKYCKMFKCRYCPHVNLRKVNIQEHEKMHKGRKPNVGSVAAASDPSGMIHRCVQCSYQCNNAGVLSAHNKVHQEWYPRSCALVDLQRSDDAQVKEFGGEMADSADVEDGDIDAGPQLEAAAISGNASLETTSAIITPIVTISATTSMSASTSASASTSSEQPRQQQSQEDEAENDEEDTRLLYFCRHCPARFLFSRELAIHRRFHRISLQHQCPNCTYTARQPSHLQAHAKVHTQEYQDRTLALCQHHQMSAEHYKPESLLKDNVWVVVEEEELPPLSKPGMSAIVPPPVKQFSCPKCPAKFFKNIALSYHLSLHGGSGPYKCRICDYTVKLYGNLVRHELVHDGEIKKNVRPNGRDSFDPECRNGVSEYDEDNNSTHHTIQFLPVDPVFGTLMHGNPKFIYPTYIKNGKMKEKRYKCHKCPSAFEKREQYKVHLSLHGSRQKYRCDRCDYSVKYYANFIQHMRKHKNNDEYKMLQGQDEQSEEESAEEEMTNFPIAPQKTAGKSIGGSPFNSMKGHHEMTTVERQHHLIQQRRRAAAEELLKDETITIIPSYWCPHCPYNSMRKDGVETHTRRHLCNGPINKTTFMCHYCDYSAPQSHFLREHNKLHFRWKPQPPGRRPETYMRCDQVELWSCSLEKVSEVKEKKLVFQDQGSDEKENKDRFFPELIDEISDEESEEEEEEEEEEDVYVDLRTGEVVSDEGNRLKSDDKPENQEETENEPESVTQELTDDKSPLPETEQTTEAQENMICD